MKLKINLPIIIISSFISLQPMAAIADESPTDPKNIETPPLDILFVIDNSRSMQLIEEPPMSPEERQKFEEFKQTITDMKFNKVGIKIRFSLDENGQLMCWHSMIHVPMDCTEITNRMFAWIKKAKKQEALTVNVRPAEQLVEDFMLRELKDIRTVEQMNASMEQFMKKNRFDMLSFGISVVTTTVEAPEDQSQ